MEPLMFGRVATLTQHRHALRRMPQPVHGSAHLLRRCQDLPAVILLKDPSGRGCKFDCVAKKRRIGAIVVDHDERQQNRDQVQHGEDRRTVCPLVSIHWNLHLATEAAGTQQRRIDRLWPVCGGENDDPFDGFRGSHLFQNTVKFPSSSVVADAVAFG